MVAARKDWLHDTSKIQRYVELWNHASLSVRAKLLKDATRDPYMKHLSWEALDELVRADVIYAINHQEKKNQESQTAAATKHPAKHHQIAANDPRLWWNKDKV